MHHRIESCFVSLKSTRFIKVGRFRVLSLAPGPLNAISASEAIITKALDEILALDTSKSAQANLSIQTRRRSTTIMDHTMQAYYNLSRNMQIQGRQADLIRKNHQVMKQIINTMKDEVVIARGNDNKDF